VQAAADFAFRLLAVQVRDAERMAKAITKGGSSWGQRAKTAFRLPRAGRNVAGHERTEREKARFLSARNLGVSGFGGER
jgi:hypothetical protein